MNIRNKNFVKLLFLILKTSYQEWIEIRFWNQGISRSIQVKNSQFKRYVSEPNQENESNFANYKNTLSKSIRNAKTLYFEAPFLQSQGSQKKLGG